MPKITEDTQNKMLDHIRDLAIEHRISIEFKTGSGSAWVFFRHVRCPEPRGYYSYYVALHEIGHIVCDHRGKEEKIEHEIEAWAWAFSHAVVPPTAKTLEKIQRSFLSYYIFYRRNKKDIPQSFWDSLEIFSISKSKMEEVEVKLSGLDQTKDSFEVGDRVSFIGGWKYLQSPRCEGEVIGKRRKRVAVRVMSIPSGHRIKAGTVLFCNPAVLKLKD